MIQTRNIIDILSIVIMCIGIANGQVNHTVLPLKVEEVHIMPTINKVPTHHDFKVEFKGMGHDIHGAVYQSNQVLLDQHLYNTASYQPSTACTLNHSTVELSIQQGIPLPQGLTIQASHVSDLSNMVFLVISNDGYYEEQVNISRKLVIYAINDSKLDLIGEVGVAELGLDQKEGVQIRMAEANGVLVVTDGVVLTALNSSNPTQKWGIPVSSKLQEDRNSSSADWLGSDYQLLQFQWAYTNTSNHSVRMVAVWNKMLQVYDFNLNMTHAFLTFEYTPPQGSNFISAVINRDFYVLAQKQLITYRMQQSGQHQVDYISLESEMCWGLNKYDSTLHMVCKEAGANYVAEMYFNASFVKVSEALRLNRYYTIIDDARKVFKFGQWNNPKLVIVGDDDLIMTPYAINRQAIIDAAELPPIQHARTLGMQDIVSLPSRSTLNETVAIGIGTSFFALFKVTERSASMVCSLDRLQSVKWSLLVQLNTTSCFSNGDIQQLQSICRVGIPYTFYVSMFQVDNSKSLTVHLVAYAILTVVALVLLGCAFHCRGLRARAAAQLQRRLQKLKKKKEMKPI